MVQASSHICPSNISDDDCNCGSVVTVWALLDSCDDNYNIPLFDGAIISASGSVMEGPE